MFSANICFCSRNLLQSWKRWPSPPRVQRLDTKIGRLQTNCFWTCDYAMDLGSVTFLRWTTGKRSGCLQKTRTAAFRSRRWGNASWQSGREHARTMHICRNRYLIIVSILGLCCIISRARESQRQRCTEEGMPLFVNYALFFVQNAFDPPHLLGHFYDVLGGSLHYSKIGQNKA